MISIANPLYDVVFKYLMEDERIARTILSALLKREIVHVEMRPQEFVGTRDEPDFPGITLYRIDFSATVIEDNGKENLLLIELQKTWLPTETRRFRRYLAYQYDRKENMTLSDGRFAPPMVTVYLLGHCLGDIEVPVLYVKRQYLDYDDKVVTKGLPNPFVDSLTHESVIVQLPLLHGKVHTRIEKVLSVFDQTHVTPGDRRLLEIDNSLYDGDEYMQPIVRRLLEAGCDSKIRYDMHVEEDFLDVLEMHDAQLYKIAKESAEKDVQLQAQSAQIQEQSAQLQEKDVQLRKSVQLMKSVFTPEQIAASLNMSIEEVKQLL